MYVKKIIRHGNSLAFTLPVAYCRHFGIQRGDFAFLSVAKDGTLTFGTFDPSKRPDLAAMVDVEHDK